MAIHHEWEEYDGGPNDRHAGRLHVTLNARGMLLINRYLFDKLGRPEKAKLLFDRRYKSIGIRAAAPADKRPYTFRSYRNGSHRELQVHAFLKHYNIVPSHTIRFTDPEVDTFGVLILDLQKVEPLVGTSRTKAASEGE